MSRIGRLPVAVGSGVQVTIGPGSLRIQGPKGALEQVLPRGITAALEGTHVVLRRSEETKSQKALHGLSRALLRCDRREDAAAALRRLLRLDPADPLGARASLAAIEAGKTWRELETSR